MPSRRPDAPESVSALRERARNARLLAYDLGHNPEARTRLLECAIAIEVKANQLEMVEKLGGRGG